MDKVEIPQPQGVFTESWSLKKLFGLLAVFGPAAIVASVAIGAGETIVVVRAGAWAGYDLLWLVLLWLLLWLWLQLRPPVLAHAPPLRLYA